MLIASIDPIGQLIVHVLDMYFLRAFDSYETAIVTMTVKPTNNA